MTANYVDADDEARHDATSEPLWNESVYADVVSADGSVGGYVRIGLYPHLGVTWWTAVVTGPGRPTITAAAYNLPLPAEGFGPSWQITEPLRVAALAWHGPAVARDNAADIYRSDEGRSAELGMDLSWRTDGTPYHYDLTTRYEIPCQVNGTLTIGGDSFDITGPGQRDHSWGVRDWWAFEWCWASARFDDGTRLHITDVRLPGGPIAFGYLQSPSVAPVRALAVTEDLGADDLPTTARIEVDGLGVTVTPLAFGPLHLVADDGRASHFPRAMARYDTDDGRTGLGWIEWNQVVKA
jgi:hypothetical protein